MFTFNYCIQEGSGHYQYKLLKTENAVVFERSTPLLQTEMDRATLTEHRFLSDSIWSPTHLILCAILL